MFERLRTQAIPALLVTHDEEDAPGTIFATGIPSHPRRGSTTLFDRHLILVIRRPLAAPAAPVPGRGER